VTLTRIELAPEVLDDLDRFVVHMTGIDLDEVGRRIEELIAAIQVLSHSPQIGRPVRGDKRELILGTGSRGYVALYRYVQPINTVFILAVRSQREAGYKRRRR
jgi:toxin ParE1/3/4